ncbi:MAG TPA: hypothetical protein VKU94_00390 [Geobacterales bacterium]|nr:hypothetical protein [Geobacterales bacterium]
MEEQLKWLAQLRRLFILALIYDFAFLDPFTVIRKPNPITGMFGLLIGAFIYLLGIYLGHSWLVMVSYFIAVVSAIWILFTSYRRRPLYVFDLEKSMKLVSEKGLKLKDSEDLEHARAIIEYSLYLSQKMKEPEEMKKYLDIAYDTWLSVLKSKGIIFTFNTRKKI